MKTKNINWIDPLQLAKIIAANYCEDWVFLYSGLNSEIKNSRSFIAIFLRDKFIIDDLKKLNFQQNQRYFGYISYEYGQNLEKIPSTQKSMIDLPKIWLAEFNLVLEFDHQTQNLTANFYDENYLNIILNFKNCETCQEKNILVKKYSSNFSDSSYIKAVEHIKKLIENGDFYQVNLTRKFFGNINITTPKQYFDLFLKLVNASAANYSSFLKFDQNYVISSSPELFLSVKNNHVISRPIKGTAPRSSDFRQDLQNKENLQKSPKEQAENLMIVDLVRNDLSRVCKASSVAVDNLFKIDSYRLLHHMSSEIKGEIGLGFDIKDVIAALFPPGSMTGAPKIKAMQIIAALEKINRGIYSGAIGYLSTYEANFSVVIRTIICKEGKFEFQVGGAITYDSDAQLELQETYHKARAILQVLGL